MNETCYYKNAHDQITQCIGIIYQHILVWMVLLDVTTIMKCGLPYLVFMCHLDTINTIWLSLLLIHTTYYKINH